MTHGQISHRKRLFTHVFLSIPSMSSHKRFIKKLQEIKCKCTSKIKLLQCHFISASLFFYYLQITLLSCFRVSYDYIYLMWFYLSQFSLCNPQMEFLYLYTRGPHRKKGSAFCFLWAFTACNLLLPEANGRIHSLLLRSSLHRSLKAALQLLWVQPPNTYMDWFES